MRRQNGNKIRLQMRLCLVVALVVMFISSMLEGTARAQKESIHDLVEQLQAKDVETRTWAARELAKREPAPYEAIPALIIALKDDDVVSSHAATALAKIGPAALPFLIQALRDKDDSLRARAAETLGYFGSDAKLALSALLNAANDPDWGVRMAVVSALGKLGDPMGVPTIIEKLRDDKVRGVRRAAAAALGALGPVAKGAIPALMQALRDPDNSEARQRLYELNGGSWFGPTKLPGVQELAQEALAKIGRAAVPAVLDELNSQDKGRQRAAVSIFTGMRSEAEGAVPALIERLESEDGQLRCDIVLCLAEIGPAAKSAVPALTRALTDSSSIVRIVAVWALKQVDPANPEALSTLLKWVRDKKNTADRMQALHTLRYFGDQKAAIEVLIELVTDPEDEVVVSAISSLGQIDPFPELAVPPIAKALRDRASVYIRMEAASVLGRSRDRDVAVPALIQALQDTEEKVRILAAEALGRHGPRPVR
jgi:HEAT repeat protein